MASYLDKQAFCERHLSATVVANTNIIVVIPCYNEPDLVSTLNSLWNCKRTICVTEILVVINSGEHDAADVLLQNEKTKQQVEEWKKHHADDKLSCLVIEIKNLPHKHAGVGLARKVGMDEAVFRFSDINNDNGIIVCLDADCTVASTYLTEIENHFTVNPKTTGCSIYFEHPITGIAFNEKNYRGIINYELFLRYYRLSLLYSGFPYSYHTIGSCMAVRNVIYQKQGGMNRRKAGEDFYFLHKVFPLGNFTELNSTCVYPSPRKSARVPFGTGSAIGKFLETDADDYLTYNFKTFTDLKLLFDNVTSIDLLSLPKSVAAFLEQNNFEGKLREIKSNSASDEQYINRFYRWFDGFMVLKFVHFVRDTFYKQQEIERASTQLVQCIMPYVAIPENKTDLLLLLRKMERG